MEHYNSMLRGFEQDTMFPFLFIRIFNYLLRIPWQENIKMKMLSFTLGAWVIFIFYIAAISRSRYSLMFCIKVVLGLDLVHSKHRNTEGIRWSIKSPLLNQLSGKVTLWKIFYLTYNQFPILRLFDVLPNFPFTTTETMDDYYL